MAQRKAVGSPVVIMLPNTTAVLPITLALRLTKCELTGDRIVPIES
jgi:hypothetical protein